ncbi:MAG: response regulator [Thermoanaerobaculia bacterium]|nr:response regulator [Thermoanaerobaculia bacterium]
MDQGRTGRILVVDDQEMERELLTERLAPLGYEIETAVDGSDAWERLNRSPSAYRVIILDRIMPRLNGLELLHRIREHEDLASTPVIFQTGAGERDQILEGIDAGCYYYLVKPYDTEILLSIVRAALSDRERREAFQAEVRDGRSALSTLRRATFEYRTIQEAAELSTLLAWVFPDPESQVIGLSELLINAVEHGNLGIGYEEKSRLNSQGKLEQEIDRRMSLEENRHKTVRVEMFREDEGIKVRIVDQGEGFDWEKFLTIDPRRAFDTHGRGIAMAKMLSFDNLEYRGRGNEVVATVDLTAAE